MCRLLEQTAYPWTYLSRNKCLVVLYKPIMGTNNDDSDNNAKKGEQSKKSLDLSVIQRG